MSKLVGAGPERKQQNNNKGKDEGGVSRVVAIKAVYYDNNGNEIVDEDEILQKLDEEKLDRQIIVNPITEISNFLTGNY